MCHVKLWQIHEEEPYLSFWKQLMINKQKSMRRKKETYMVSRFNDIKKKL